MSERIALQEVFVVDDDPSIRLLLTAWLESAGYRVRAFEGGRALLRALKTKTPFAICLDVMMPEYDGMETLEAIRKRGLEVPVLVLTARDTVETAVDCMRLGAIDYVLKPIDRSRLLANLERIRRVPEPSMVPPASVPPPSPDERQHGLVGTSPAMQRLYRQISKVAASGISVFISGESGTGKELVASAIHRAGPWATGPLVPLNCGAIPESLQESELFGHEKGSFTGANSTRVGKFEQAQSGTIFLDEIAELSATAQVRLLRVIQERRLERVGANRSVDLRIRVISATHRPLRELVDAGRFREDLFYRLVVYPIRVPPLRERGEDITLLAEHFLRKYEGDYGPGNFSISDDALDVLRGYHWPGNVRELENVVHGAMVRADSETIGVLDLPPELRAGHGLRLMASNDAPEERADIPSASSGRGVRLSEIRDVGSHSPPRLSNSRSVGSRSSSNTLARKPVPASFTPRTLPASPPVPVVTILDAEKRAISNAIEYSGGNLTRAAKQLGIGRATLYRKLARYGLRRTSSAASEALGA